MALAAIVGIIIATVLATVPSFRAHSDSDSDSDSFSPANWPNKTKPAISWPTYNDPAWVKETSTGSEVKYQVKNNVLYMEPNNHDCDAEGDNCKVQAQFGTGDYSSSDHNKVTVFAKIGKDHMSKKIYTHKPDGITTKDDKLYDGDIRAIAMRGDLCFPGPVSLDNAFEGTDYFETDTTVSNRTYGGFGNLVDISGLSHLKTLTTSDGTTSVKNLVVTSMRSTFENNYTLQDLTGLDGWDTSQVQSFYYTFGNSLGYEPVYGHLTDSGLAHIAKWDVNSASDMSYMFTSQMSLTSLQKLSGWQPHNVTTMSHIFYDNSNLESLEGLGSWLPAGSSQIRDLSAAFAECGNLTKIDALNTWDVSNLTILDSTFLRDISLTSFEALAAWKTSSVKDLYSTFNGCSKVKSLKGLDNWDTSKVTDMSRTFYAMSRLNNIEAIAKWDTSQVTTMNSLFYSDSDLHDLTSLKGWNLKSLDVTEHSNNKVEYPGNQNTFYGVDWYKVGIPAQRYGGQKFLASTSQIDYCNDVLHDYSKTSQTVYAPARHFSEAYQDGTTLVQKTMPEWYTAYGSLKEGDTGYSAGVVYERPARLTITKIVTNQPASDKSRTFTIKLKLDNVSGTQTYTTLSGNDDTATKTGSKECTNGVCTFELMNGESVYLSELPPTTFTVSEEKKDVPQGYKLNHIEVCDNPSSTDASSCGRDSVTYNGTGTLAAHQNYTPFSYDPDTGTGSMFDAIGMVPNLAVIYNDYETKPLTLSVNSNVRLAYGIQTDKRVKPTKLAYGSAKADEFTLKLCPANELAKDSTASTKTGCIDTKTKANSTLNSVFDTFQLKKAGTYKYTITQVSGSDSSVKYDGETFDVTITVTDKDKNGNLLGYLTAAQANAISVNKSGTDAFGAVQPSTEVKNASDQTDANADSYSMTESDTDQTASDATINAKTDVLDVRTFTNFVPQTNKMPATGGMGVTPFILLALVVFVGGAWLAFGRRK